MPADIETLTSIVVRILRIETVTLGDAEKNFIVRYRGQLYGDSQTAYDQLADWLRPLEITPLFRLEEGQHTVILVRGIIQPKPSRIWVNVIMFILTVFSVLLTGALYAYEGPADVSAGQQLLYALTHLGQGAPFAVSMMAILLAHEFGHYIAGRLNGTAVTLPYYIPLPVLSPFGTLGAFIQIKNFPKNRNALLDLGIAGPLAGFIVAVPVLIYGLATSEVKPIEAPQPGQAIMLEGNSLLYSALKLAVKGEWLPTPPPDSHINPLLFRVMYFFSSLPTPVGGEDVMLNSVAWAGWAGLLVTALNLIPAGQLDGGHLLFVLAGRKAVRWVWVILAILLLLGLAWWGWWLWAFLIFLFGRFYAEPLDQITPLDPRRKVLAVVGLVIFVLIFTPTPLRELFFVP